jgi:cytochrome c
MKTIIKMLALMTFVTSSHGAENAVVAATNTESMPPLAKTLGCIKCHSIDKKGKGPAWRGIANKYRKKNSFNFADDAYSLEDGLVHKVSLGGKSHWGDQIMATNDPDGKRQNDIRALVRFILALPPKPQS